MQRGTLILYDNTGEIFFESGEAQGDILPHKYPIGIPYMEIPFGAMDGKRVLSIDVSTTPHTPITEDVAIPKTEEQKRTEELEALQNYALDLEYQLSLYELGIGGVE